MKEKEEGMMTKSRAPSARHCLVNFLPDSTKVNKWDCKIACQLDVVIHAWNPRTQDTEAGEWLQV